MNAQSSIFRLSASDVKPGVCSICGQSVLIRYRDSATGQVTSICCLGAMVIAEQALARAGIRHPNLLEAQIHND